MEKGKVLIIEDDANIRDVLQLALDFEGYEVLTAQNGQEGLDILAQTKPNIILLDLMMPVMNGWEFSEIVQENVNLKTIPIVVVSAFSEKASSVSCTAFVPKPLDLETLLLAVKEHITVY